MPPTYGPSLSRARRRLTDEPEPSRFFPAALPYGQRSSFDSYVSPGRLSSDASELEKIMEERDARNTRLAQNAGLRNDLEMKERLRPALERQTLTGAELGAAKNESALTNNPFDEESDRETLITEADQQRAQRELLPGDVALKKKLTEQAIETADPYSKRFRKPEDIDLYESFKEDEDDTMPETKRMESAFRKANQIAKDRATIDILNDAIYTGDKDAESLIETVTDSRGRIKGQRLKDDADPVKVRGIVMKHQNARRDSELRQRQMNKKVEQIDRLASRLSSRISAWERSNMLGTGSLPKDTPEIEEARKKLIELETKRFDMTKEDDIIPETVPHPSAPGQGGLLEQGNIDLSNRPRVKNADGSISTVRSASFNFDGKEVLLPTVSDDGKILSDKEAVEQFKKTGRHLGIFTDPKSATDYANQLHKDQEKKLGESEVKPPSSYFK